MDYVIQPEGGRFLVRVESPKTRRAYQIRFARKPTEQDIQDAVSQLDALPQTQALQFRIPDRTGAKPITPASIRNATQSTAEPITMTEALQVGQHPLSQRQQQRIQQLQQQARRIIEEDQNPAALVRSLYGVLNIPLRTAAAAVGATLTRGGEVYGKEAGRPKQVARGDWQQRFWSLVADPELEYGAVLEAAAPSIPRPTRQAAAVLADLLLDPLVWLTPAKLGQAARIGQPSKVLSRALGINAAEAAASRSPLRGIGLGLHLLLDPRVTAAAIREGMAAQPGQRLSTALASLAQAQALRKAVAETGPVLSREAIAQRHKYRGLPEEALEYARKAVADLPESHPDVQALRRVEERMSTKGISYAPGEDVETVYRLAVRAGWNPPQTYIPSVKQVAAEVEKETGELGQAAQTELARLLRLARREPGVYERVLSAWKASKTVYNPPSWIRNLYQNFILQYLAGEPMQPHQVARGLWTLLTNPRARREAWEQTAQVSGRMAEVGDVGLRGLPGKVAQKAAEGYESMDRAAATVLSLITGRPPQTYLFNYGEVPETIDWLRRTGIAPFVSWQYFALPAVVRGMIDQPHRLRRVLQAVLASQPEEEKQGEWIGLPAGREVRVGSVLPLNPADYGPESDLLDPLKLWFLRPISMLGEIREGEGYKPVGADQRYYDLPAYLMWAKDVALPPAASYYLPGIISPPAPREGQRQPRTRTDYLLGLLGFPVRPVDKSADERATIRQKQHKLNQLQRRLKEEMKQ